MGHQSPFLDLEQVRLWKASPVVGRITMSDCMLIYQTLTKLVLVPPVRIQPPYRYSVIFPKEGTAAPVKGFGRRPCRGLRCRMQARGRRPKASKGGNRGSERRYGRGAPPMGICRLRVVLAACFRVGRERRSRSGLAGQRRMAVPRRGGRRDLPRRSASARRGTGRRKIWSASNSLRSYCNVC